MTRDWICSVKWVQATPTDGGWLWSMYLVDPPFPEEEQTPKLTQIASGVALWKLGVYWQVFKVCRQHGLRFRPNVRGPIPEKDNGSG